MAALSDFTHIQSQADLSERAARHIYDLLERAIKARGEASLMVSGGQSPVSVYTHLSQFDLEWSKVHISLVDDRWVDSGANGSNEALIRKTLLNNKASAAKFISLKTLHARPENGLSEIEARFSDLVRPFDLCVMGMGTDGHTASWFPNSKGLHAAMDMTNANTVCAIDAQGCSGAGEHPLRISLTLSAVMRSRALLLYIPGPKKAEVFKDSAEMSVLDAPVGALRAAGSRLSVFSGSL